jgi:hypothetical protein
MKTAYEVKTEQGKCPSCGSEEVRRSQMRGFVEQAILRPFGVRAYRCEGCDARYYGKRRTEERREKTRR